MADCHNPVDEYQRYVRLVVTFHLAAELPRASCGQGRPGNDDWRIHLLNPVDSSRNDAWPGHFRLRCRRLRGEEGVSRVFVDHRSGDSSVCEGAYVRLTRVGGDPYGLLWTGSLLGFCHLDHETLPDPFPRFCFRTHLEPGAGAQRTGALGRGSLSVQHGLGSAFWVSSAALLVTAAIALACPDATSRPRLAHQESSKMAEPTSNGTAGRDVAEKVEAEDNS